MCQHCRITVLLWEILYTKPYGHGATNGAYIEKARHVPDFYTNTPVYIVHPSQKHWRRKTIPKTSSLHSFTYLTQKHMHTLTRTHANTHRQARTNTHKTTGKMYRPTLFATHSICTRLYTQREAHTHTVHTCTLDHWHGRTARRAKGTVGIPRADIRGGIRFPPWGVRLSGGAQGHKGELTVFSL